jgi:hypothetical protein
VAALGALALLSGCAASLSSFRPAHVADSGEVQVASGIDISYPTGTITDVIDAAEVVEELGTIRPLTPEESQTIVQGAAALGMNPPSLNPHVGVATGAFEGWEVGARLAASDWRLGVRHQLLYQAKSGVDLSVGVGFGTSIFDPPIGRALSSVEIQDYGRYNLDVPVAVGKSGVWYRWWAGPKLMMSRVSQRMSVELSGGDVVDGSVDASGYYLGAYAGAALGYESIFIGPELAVVRLFGNAEVRVYGQRVNSEMTGTVIHPGFAVMGEF